MDETKLRTIAQLQEFLDATPEVSDRTLLIAFVKSAVEKTALRPNYRCWWGYWGQSPNSSCF